MAEYIVYVLISEINPQKHYVGLSQNLPQRLKQHNRGDTNYTRNFKPWKIETYVAFANKQLAESFERYLKSGSGHAFLKRHFLPTQI